MEAAGIAPGDLFLQVVVQQYLMKSGLIIAANTQPGDVTSGHFLTAAGLEINYILARWQHLPQHIRETILLLIRSLDRVVEESNA